MALSKREKGFSTVNLTHEIRTPLNAVIGYSRELLDRQEWNPEVQEKLKRIHAGGMDLLHLLTDLIDIIGQPSQHQKNCEKSWFDPLMIFTPLAEEYRIQAQEKALSLRFPPPQEIPRRIYGRYQVYRLIIKILLDNAVKFTSRGGITLHLAGRENTLITRISDSGIGIEESDLERVFEPFYQVEGGKNRHFEGAGLGLPLARILCEREGGVLHLQNQKEGGLLAEVQLPYESTLDVLTSEDIPDPARDEDPEPPVLSLNAEERRGVEVFLETLKKAAGVFDPQYLAKSMQNLEVDDPGDDFSRLRQKMEKALAQYDDLAWDSCVNLLKETLNNEK